MRLAENKSSSVTTQPGDAFPDHTHFIAHINLEKGWGGGEVQTLNISQALRERGHRIVIVCAKHGVLSRRARQLGFKVMEIPVERAFRSILALMRIFSFHAFDVIHMHTYLAHRWGVVAASLVGHRAIRIVSRRVDVNHVKSFWTTLFYDRAIDHVLATSHSIAESLIKAGIPAQKITTTHAGVTPSIASAIKSKTRDGVPSTSNFLISNVAHFWERKGQIVLINAFAQLLADFPNSHLLLIGDTAPTPGQLSYTRRIRRLIADLGLNSQVSILGMRNDVRDIVSKSDIFVLPSAREGLGVSLLEAMAEGVAVIGTNVGGIPEAIVDEETGLLVPYGDPVSLAKSMSRLLANKPLREKLGRQARAFVSSNFSNSLLCDRHETLYSEIINRNNPRHFRAIDSVDRIAFHIPHWLGDNVMSVSLLREIQARFPHASITIVGNNAHFDLWRACGMHDFIEITTLASPWHLTRLKTFARTIAKRQFNLAVILPSGREYALLYRLAGVPIRAGYASDRRGFLLTHSCPITKNFRAVRYGYSLRQLFRGKNQLHSVSRTTQTDELKVSEQLTAEARLVLRRYSLFETHFGIVHPGAQYGPAKRWPDISFAATIDRLFQEFGLRSVIVGSAHERDLAERIARQTLHQPIVLCGETSLAELIGILSLCRIFIGNDSGPLHLAALLGVPSVGIFGSSSPAWTAPRYPHCHIVRRHLHCAPCYQSRCPLGTTPCLSDLRVVDVLTTVRSLLNRQTDISRMPQAV